MKVRAKFKCIEISKRSGDSNVVKFHPVTSTSPENSEFFKWTPYGIVEMGTINDNVIGFFEIDKEYYLDFTKAE